MCGGEPAEDVGLGGPEPCSRCRAAEILDQLEPRVRSELEELVAARSWLAATDALRGHRRSLGLYDAQDVIWLLKARLGVSLDPPLPPVSDLISELESLG